MRAIKNTSLSFGMVNVPIKLYSAVEDHDLKLNQFHDGCGGGVTYVKQCKSCEAALASNEIVKGKIVDDVQVIVTEDDLDSLDIVVGPEISVEQFIKSDEIDPIAMEKHYFVAPSEASALEGFSMIRDVLEESHRVAVCRFVMRRSGSIGKEHMAILRPYGRALILDTIAYHDEIRKPEFSILDTPVKVNPKVREVARSIVDSMTEPWNPLVYADQFTEKLSELIDIKAAGGEAPKVAAKAESGGGDLLSKLEASAAVAKRRKPATKAALRACSSTLARPLSPVATV
jgi:DNA end-binding protein Ku